METKESRETPFFLEKQKVRLKDFQTEGWILDLGGGGEGIIGQLKGSQVVAIDPVKNELLEAPDGPLKIIMDARKLEFLDESFNMVTAFFTLMYIPAADHPGVLREAWRVLRPSGKMLIWEAALPTRMDQTNEFVAFYLEIQLPYQEVQTGYGTKWPAVELDKSYYQNLAEQTGFKILQSESQTDRGVFFLELQKSG